MVEKLSPTFKNNVEEKSNQYGRKTENPNNLKYGDIHLLSRQDPLGSYPPIFRLKGQIPTSIHLGSQFGYTRPNVGTSGIKDNVFYATPGG